MYIIFHCYRPVHINSTQHLDFLIFFFFKEEKCCLVISFGLVFPAVPWKCITTTHIAFSEGRSKKERVFSGNLCPSFFPSSSVTKVNKKI